MDQPPAPLPIVLPLIRASAAQFAQAILTVREVLTVYYPAVTLEQWQQAMERVECPLYVTADGITATAPGLRDLIVHFESLPLTPATPAGPGEAPSLTGWKTMQKVKATYEVLPDMLEALARASFWRRVGKSYLVNRALVQLLADLPESRVPIPPSEF